MNIKDLCIESNLRAHRKGFYDDGPPPIPERLALIHSEVSEALEAYRDGEMVTTISSITGKPTGFPSEIADVVIRCADLAEQCGFDLAAEIRLKSDYNETRPPKHGRKVL